MGKRKIALLLGIVLLVVPAACLADWSVTVTWTRSTGPNLDYEECQLDDVTQCTVQETDPTSCNFIVTDLTGQEVKIVSYNTQGAFAEYVVGTLLAVPAPAAGGNITIVYVP